MTSLIWKKANMLAKSYIWVEIRYCQPHAADVYNCNFQVIMLVHKLIISQSLTIFLIQFVSSYPHAHHIHVSTCKTSTNIQNILTSRLTERVLFIAIWLLFIVVNNTRHKLCQVWWFSSAKSTLLFFWITKAVQKEVQHMNKRKWQKIQLKCLD